MLNDTTSRLEAFLFAEGGALSLRKLESLLHLKRDELHAALEGLRAHLEGSGLALITTDTEASLATAPKTGDALKAAYEEELSRDIGDAGLEVLAIVLYRGPSTRTEIDYIRGVNTSWTIRTLLARGLLDRAVNERDAREYLYRPTPELLAHLGVQKPDDVPDHASISAELAAFEKQEPLSEENHAE